MLHKNMLASFFKILSIMMVVNNKDKEVSAHTCIRSVATVRTDVRSVATVWTYVHLISRYM